MLVSRERVEVPLVRVPYDHLFRVDRAELLHLYDLLLGQPQECRQKVLVGLEHFNEFYHAPVGHVELAVHAERLARHLCACPLQPVVVNTPDEQSGIGVLVRGDVVPDPHRLVLGKDDPFHRHLAHPSAVLSPEKIPVSRV